jgi:uncharacterized protein DUF2877
VRVVLAGAGARQAVRPGASGTVLASLSRACYVDLPGGLAALVAPDVHPGPMHLVLDGEVPRVGKGAPVVVAGGKLVVAGVSIDLRGMGPWSGALPLPPLVRDRAVLLREVLEVAARGSSLPGMGNRAVEGLERLEAADIAGAAPCLGGLGPGLTPAGDDTLAGALFAVRAACGPPVEPALARLAGGIRTGRISLAFLEWAVQGQSLAPVHDLVAAAVRGDREGAAVAARALADIGATSGADFALGLRAGLPVESCSGDPRSRTA